MVVATQSTYFDEGDLQTLPPVEVPAPVAEDVVEVERASATLTLLGSWALHLDGQRLSMTASAQRLLVLLALKGCQRRGYLAGLLWPDVRDEQAMTRLRCTLWRMRRQHADLVETREQTVALGPSVVVDVDELVATARETIESTLSAQELEDRCAMLVHAPELLLGWYDDWVLEERDRINQLRVRALEALVDRLLRAARCTEAFEAAAAATRLDPLRESTHRAVMRVYLAEGNPALARRQLERYRTILRTEVGVEGPTTEMLDLLRPGNDRAALQKILR